MPPLEKYKEVCFWQVKLNQEFFRKLDDEWHKHVKISREKAKYFFDDVDEFEISYAETVLVQVTGE